MSSYTGWNSTVVNLAQSIQNLWITVMDMRCIVTDLKNCCGQVDCSGFILDYEISTDVNRQNVTINFFNKMFFPGTGYANCTGTDTGQVIQVAGTGITSPLNTSRTYTIKVYGCISKDGKTCYKEAVKYNYPPCANIGQIVISIP